MPWPLLAICVVQAALSVRLVVSTTAFQDEALYLWAGHLEWSHWLTGAPIPAFNTYFSGAPVVYPPLGALADTYGGLITARLLSLAFMLGATSLVYHVTRRIFGGRSAFFAAALFASLGTTQFLGALATYDAMAIMLLALATWLGIRAADTRGMPRFALLAMVGGALALADATKYAASLFDPVVVAVVATYVWHRRGLLAGFAAAVVSLLTLAVLLACVLLVGGRAYWAGVTSTTLARSAGEAPVPAVLYVSALWIGSVVVLALIGAVAVCVRNRRWSMRSLAIVLSGALFLAPAQQARIHTITSLFKHVGFGAWFGCILAGFALSCLLDAVPKAKAPAAKRVSLAATIANVIIGTAFATSHFYSWPNSAAFIAKLSRVAAVAHGPILEANSLPQYYVPSLRWRTSGSTAFFSYVDPATGRRERGAPAYADAISQRYFSIIALDFSSTPAEDTSIVHDLIASRQYRRVAVVRYIADGSKGSYQIWVLKSSADGRTTAASLNRAKIH